MRKRAGRCLKRQSASGDPAMVSGFRMAAILSQVTGTLPVTPSGRIATGRSSQDMLFSVSCPFAWSVSRAATATVDRSCENARFVGARVLKTNSTANIVLLKQRLVTALVRLAQVVEQRTPRRHQLQQTATRMIVLHVRLEMLSEIIDAFRQDRDLN